MRVWRGVGNEREALVAYTHERVRNGWVELRPAAARDLRAGIIDRHCAAVRTVARHRVERVRDCEDACPERDLFTSEPRRVALAVPALVVMANDLRDVLKERDSRDDPRAEFRVALHRDPLGL